MWWSWTRQECASSPFCVSSGKAAPVDDDGDITLANGDDDIPDAVLAQITSSSDSQAVTATAAGKKLSRGQRKRLLKKQRFLRQMDGTASALKRAPALSQAELKRRKEQDKGLGGVAGLKDVLNEVAEATIKAAVGALHPWRVCVCVCGCVWLCVANYHTRRRANCRARHEVCSRRRVATHAWFEAPACRRAAHAGCTPCSQRQSVCWCQPHVAVPWPAKLGTPVVNVRTLAIRAVTGWGG